MRTLPLLSLEAQSNGDDYRLTCQRIEPLDEAVARAGIGLKVFLDEAKAAAPLAATLGREGDGRGRVNIMIPVGEGREVEVVLPQGYAITAKGRAALRAIPGIVDVQEV